MPPKFTPTEQRFLAVLADGMPHSKDELHAVLDDPLAEPNTVGVHLAYLRKKLEKIGQTIVCQSRGNRRPGLYRHVRLLIDASE